MITIKKRKSVSFQNKNILSGCYNNKKSFIAKQFRFPWHLLSTISENRNEFFKQFFQAIQILSVKGLELR